jgi:hypothetical protein
MSFNKFIESEGAAVRNVGRLSSAAAESVRVIDFSIINFSYS